MNNIVNDKKGHNIVNDKQLLIIQTAYFLHDQLVYKTQVMRFCLYVCLFVKVEVQEVPSNLNEMGEGRASTNKKILI